LKLFKGNVAGRAWTYISLSSVFFSIGVVMFLVDALAPIGLVATGRSHADRRSVLFVYGIEEELSLLGEQGSLLPEPLLDISSIGQIILYLKKANRTTVCRLSENIRRVESFSLE
jgi:hypothetical protein